MEKEPVDNVEAQSPEGRRSKKESRKGKEKENNLSTSPPAQRAGSVSPTSPRSARGEKKGTKQYSMKKPMTLWLNANAEAGKNGDSESIYTILPDDTIQNLTDTKPLIKIAGPLNEEQATYKEVVCCQTISTYPRLPSTGHREGDPICDRYQVRMYADRAIVAVADGCNWGNRPREAASKATEAFAEYIESRLSDMNDVKEAAHFLLRAFSVAHNKIIEGKDDVWEAGTTTLLGGLLVRLASTADGGPERGWGFIAGSVGDCKAFHFSASTKKVTDITTGNRLMSRSYDAKDPGGRLGPYIAHGSPDLRNLALFYTGIEDNDMILIVTDGVHDNFDPENMGKSVAEAGQIPRRQLGKRSHTRRPNR